MTQSKKYRTGDELRLTIERIVPRGLGIAFAEGVTFFVPLVAAGDVVKVRVASVKKRTAFADLVEVIEPSPERVVPPCPHFGVCGGCDFQQLSYEAQLSAKVDIIRDSLKRIARLDYENEIPIIPSPRPFGYRTRARWHASQEQARVGYYARESHEIVDVLTCPILETPLEAAITSLRENQVWNYLQDGRSDIEAAVGERGEIAIDPGGTNQRPADLTFTINSIEYSYSARTFFQANRSLLPALIEVVTAGLSGSLAIDLYSGVGLFSLPLAKSFGDVVAVEANPESIRYAKQNRARANLGNLQVVRSDVEAFIADYAGDVPDALVIDPPRSGASLAAVRNLLRMAVPTLVYVSCDPAILARDLAVLGTKYEIAQITALDLFPQTHHVETVARLHLR